MVKSILDLFPVLNRNKKSSNPTVNDKRMKKSQENKDIQDSAKNKKIERERIQRERHEEQKPLIKILKEKGLKVSSLWDLIGEKRKNISLTPVLIEHLGKKYSKHTKESIVRALGNVNFSTDDSVNALIEYFKAEENEELQWVAGVSLSNVATERQHVEQVVDLLKERQYGGARSQLPHFYAKHYKLESIPLLMELLSDRSIVAETIVTLGNLKALAAKDKITILAEDKDSWVRGKAKAALKKINKAHGEADPNKGELSSTEVKMHERHETSMCFDMENIEPFLIALNNKYNFSLNVEQLVSFTYLTEFEDERFVILKLNENYKNSNMEFRVFMGDVDSPTLYLFFELSELANNVGDFMLEWAENIAM